MTRASRAWAGVWARLSPLAVAALVLLVASGFATARWAVAADRDVGRFVLAGDAWVEPSAGVPVLPGDGYDGQFAYRLALDPTSLERTSNGVTLDAPLRLQRIAYPVLAWGLSLGQDGLVPEAMVVVNVLGLGVLALLAALLARDAGRVPAAGLLLLAWPGFVTSLARDLTEITTCALLLAGVLALRRGRVPLAALLLAGAVLSRESALLLAGALAAGHLWTSRRWSDSAWLALPAGVFVAWQAVCAAVVGRLPVTSSSGKNLVLPLQDLAPAAAGWVQGAVALDRGDLITLGQAVALAVLVAAAARAVPRAGLSLSAAWAVALLLVLSLSDGVWRGPADFRTASELAVLSGAVLLTSGRSLRLPGILLGILLGMATLGTVLFRVTSL